MFRVASATTAARRSGGLVVVLEVGRAGVAREARPVRSALLALSHAPACAWMSFDLALLAGSSQNLAAQVLSSGKPGLRRTSVPCNPPWSSLAAAHWQQYLFLAISYYVVQYTDSARPFQRVIYRITDAELWRVRFWSWRWIVCRGLGPRHALRDAQVGREGPGFSIAWRAAQAHCNRVQASEVEGNGRGGG